MSLKPKFFAREIPAFGQKWEGFWPSLDRAWFDASTVLLEHTIDPAPLQFGQQEKGGEERIADVHTTNFESIKQVA